MESNNISLVMLGLVRSAAQLGDILDLYKPLQDEGTIDRFRLVTWTDQVDRHPGLRKKLDSHGIELIELPPISVKSHGNIIQQMRQFYHGLLGLGRNTYVLKTRTDLVIDPDFIRILVREKKYREKVITPNRVFHRKIWVPYFEITKPFYISDECFAGYVDDLWQLYNLDSSYDHQYANIGVGITHIRRFIPPFLKQYPLLEDYLNVAGYCGWRKGCERFSYLQHCLQSKVYLAFLAVYYTVLNSHFIVDLRATPNQVQFRLNYMSPSTRVDSKGLVNRMVPPLAWNNSAGGWLYGYDLTWLSNTLGSDVGHDRPHEALLVEIGQELSQRRTSTRELNEFLDVGANVIKISQPQEKIRNVYHNLRHSFGKRFSQ
ncbi:hypothetical protein [Kordiimonas aestuarii]|uniref:hypothetical protein n=1 Tax=Kordiimonas aestuarii TaxID=1005925 RepID=UPI0021CE6A72|nr:hypothetical protein [Kordiimonas aestuarii]